MVHFSKFIRPQSVKIGCEIDNKQLMATAVSNPDGKIALVIFNPTDQIKTVKINFNNKSTTISIHSNALQTMVIKP
jgi:glucosylceramidase